MAKVQKEFEQEHIMSLLAYVGLSVVTLGFYTFYFHYVLIESMKKRDMGDSADLHRTWVVSIATAIAGTLLMAIADDSPTLGLMAYVSVLASIVFMFLFALKTGKTIKEHYDTEYNIFVSVNPFVLFFFPGLGLMAMLNSLNDAIDYYGKSNQRNIVHLEDHS